MALQKRWADVIGDEVERPDRAAQFYLHLAAAVSILREDALHYLMQQRPFMRWLENQHFLEAVWQCAHDTQFTDPTPEEWHNLVKDLMQEHRVELSSLRPYSAHAEMYYRHYCDERADEMDCNDLFVQGLKLDKEQCLSQILNEPSVIMVTAPLPAVAVPVQSNAKPMAIAA